MPGDVVRLANTPEGECCCSACPGTALPLTGPLFDHTYAYVREDY